MQGRLCDGRSTRGTPRVLASLLSAFSALRNGAGIDTRPLASNLLWWLPRKWVIRTRPPFARIVVLVGAGRGERATGFGRLPAQPCTVAPEAGGWAALG